MRSRASLEQEGIPPCSLDLARVYSQLRKERRQVESSIRISTFHSKQIKHENDPY